MQHTVAGQNRHLEEALSYARAGLPVFPVARPVLGVEDSGKRPAIPGRGGLHHASADPGQLAAWWGRGGEYRGASIGLPVPEGVAVLDVDPRHGGAESLARLEAELGPVPRGVVQTTGGGGPHLFVRVPPGVALTQTELARRYPGIDLRKRGNYVVVAPSGHWTGGVYRWQAGADIREAEIPDCPPALLELLRKPERKPRVRSERAGSSGGARARADESTEEFAEAVRRWNDAHPVDYQTPDRECPACGHRGCFGPVPEAPERWYCFSASHDADSGGCGNETDGGGWSGDALDLEACRRRVRPVDVLLEDGYLEKQRAKARAERPRVAVNWPTPNGAHVGATLEAAREAIAGAVRGWLADPTKGALDLSAPPGTGKTTAAVLEHLRYDRACVAAGRRRPVLVLALGGDSELVDEKAQKDIRDVLRPLGYDRPILVGKGRQGSDDAKRFRCTQIAEAVAKMDRGLSGCWNCRDRDECGSKLHASPAHDDVPSYYLAAWNYIAAELKDGGVLVIHAAALRTALTRAKLTGTAVRIVLDDTAAADTWMPELELKARAVESAQKAEAAAREECRDVPGLFAAALTRATDRDELPDDQREATELVAARWEGACIRAVFRDRDRRQRGQRLARLFRRVLTRGGPLLEALLGMPWKEGEAVQSRFASALSLPLVRLFRASAKSKTAPFAMVGGDGGIDIRAPLVELLAHARRGRVLRLGVVPMPSPWRKAAHLSRSISVAAPNPLRIIATPGRLPRLASWGVSQKGGRTDDLVRALVTDLAERFGKRLAAIVGAKDRKALEGAEVPCLLGHYGSDSASSNKFQGCNVVFVRRSVARFEAFAGEVDMLAAMTGGALAERDPDKGFSPAATCLETEVAVPLCESTRELWASKRAEDLTNALGRIRAALKGDGECLAIVADQGIPPGIGGRVDRPENLDEFEALLGFEVPRARAAWNGMKAAGAANRKVSLLEYMRGDSSGSLRGGTFRFGETERNRILKVLEERPYGMGAAIARHLGVSGRAGCYRVDTLRRFLRGEAVQDQGGYLEQTAEAVLRWLEQRERTETTHEVAPAPATPVAQAKVDNWEEPSGELEERVAVKVEALGPGATVPDIAAAAGEPVEAVEAVLPRLRFLPVELAEEAPPPEPVHVVAAASCTGRSRATARGRASPPDPGPESPTGPLAPAAVLLTARLHGRPTDSLRAALDELQAVQAAAAALRQGEPLGDVLRILELRLRCLAVSRAGAG